MKITNSSPCVGTLGRYRLVHLTKIVDPRTESRRCELRRHVVTVFGVDDYHTDIDIVSHLGTHVEAPSHHMGLTKDVTDLSFEQFVGRGVLLKLESCEPNALITRSDMDRADGSRVRAGDIVVLDSPYQSEPFLNLPDDRRPHLSTAAAQWLLDKRVKAVGFGDGICIEHNAEHCVACHDILLGNDILIIEVMKNLDQLRAETFLIALMPLPIMGLDSSPVNVVAIEGVPGI